MPEKLDQVALAVRTTLVLIGTHREGSNFRPLRYHASAGAIFQKARTRPALTMPAVRYGSLRQAATWASAAASALTASIWIAPARSGQCSAIDGRFCYRCPSGRPTASTCRSCPHSISGRQTWAGGKAAETLRLL